MHRRSHLEPEWAKKRIPWHYDHHMNSNQDANWCVTRHGLRLCHGHTRGFICYLKEANPLGLPLPAPLSKALTQAISRFSPAKWVEHKPKLVQPVVVEEEQTNRWLNTRLTTAKETLPF